MGEAKRRKKTGEPAAARKRKTSSLYMVAGTLVLVAIATGLYFLGAGPSPTSDDLPVAAPGAEPFPAELDQYGVSIGSPTAPVVVREFADYQCPACAWFADASKQLRERYVASGKVRFVFFDFPLQQHANAMPAAQATHCAGDQDAYWPMHEKLFASQKEWSGSNDPVATFTRYASDLGMDERRFRGCLTTELHRDAVEQSRTVAMRLQVASTPTVLVGNVRMTRPGWGQLSALVERELASGPSK